MEERQGWQNPQKQSSTNLMDQQILTNTEFLHITLKKENIN